LPGADESAGKRSLILDHLKLRRPVYCPTATAKLPKEQEGRYWSFLTDKVFYTALLLILPHFEKGG
jgi:hypothetical protein